MNTVVALVVWWTFGMGGAYLLWIDWRRSYAPNQRCPTPIGAIGIVVAGVFGIVALAVGILVTARSILDGASKKISKDSWWRKPLCGPR